MWYELFVKFFKKLLDTGLELCDNEGMMKKAELGEGKEVKLMKVKTEMGNLYEGAESIPEEEGFWVDSDPWRHRFEWNLPEGWKLKYDSTSHSHQAIDPTGLVREFSFDNYEKVFKAARAGGWKAYEAQILREQEEKGRLEMIEAVKKLKNLEEYLSELKMDLRKIYGINNSGGAGSRRAVRLLLDKHLV